MDGLAVVDSRQRIERHYTTWINRQVAKWIGHDGQMPIEELSYALMMLEGVVPDAPNPPIQVAQGDGFIWNETATQDMLYSTWERKKDALARKHLSTHAYGLWQRMTRDERLKNAHTYQRALDMVKASKHRGDTTGIDQALRILKATAPKPRGKPIISNNGRSITHGLCYGCLDCLICIGAREGAERCNDFTARGEKPARAVQTPVKKADRGQGTTYMPRPLLKVGI
jgi:hypothetical protein